MRIAYICADSGIPVFGRRGNAIHVQEIIRAFRGHGAQVDLFAVRFDGDPPPDLADVTVHGLPGLLKGPPAPREQAALAANSDLRAALEQHGPFDIIYERYSLWSSAGMVFARDRGIPGVLEVNAPLIEEQAEYRKLADRPGAQRVAEQVFADAMALIAVSDEVATYLKRYPGTDGRVHVIANGVNPNRFPVGLRPGCPGPPGTFTVGFVGTFRPWHGLETLVEAFGILHDADPNTRLLLVGDGKGRAQLEADLAARGLQQATHLTGQVAASEVPGLLASMHVAVAPYPNLTHFYFSPLKVYEYMAAGLPVVVSRVGQLVELIQDGVTGLLCPPGDAQALAAALGRLRGDPELCTRLGDAARAEVCRHHTWHQVAGRILTVAESSLRSWGNSESLDARQPHSGAARVGSTGTILAGTEGIRP